MISFDVDVIQVEDELRYTLAAQHVQLAVALGCVSRLRAAVHIQPMTCSYDKEIYVRRSI